MLAQQRDESLRRSCSAIARSPSVASAFAFENRQCRIGLRRAVSVQITSAGL